MLSADVPEFVPRSCQPPASSGAETEPRQSPRHAGPLTPSPGTHRQSPRHAGPLTPSPGTHRPPTRTRHDPALVPKSFPWPGERQRAVGLQGPKHSWRQPKEAFSNPRESPTLELSRHERDTETLQGTDATKGKRKTVIENLEFHIKNKFVTTPNPSRSYTRILKSKHPTNITAERQSSKQQDFSFSTEGQWPTLDESLPLNKVPEKSNEPSAVGKNNNNPWVSRSNEGSPLKNPWQDRTSAEQSTDSSVRPKSSPIKSPVKHTRKNIVIPWQEKDTAGQASDSCVRPRSIGKSSPAQRPTNYPANPWQGRSTGEQMVNAAVRPKITAGHAKTSESSVIKTPPASRPPPRQPGTDSPVGDDSWRQSHSLRLHKDLNDKPDQESGRDADANTGLNPKAKHSLVMQSQKEVPQATQDATTPDSELFQWKIMGEKKRVKIKKPQEVAVRGSPRLQAFRGDDNRYDEKEASKLNQEQTTKAKDYVLDLSRTKDGHSLSPPETPGAMKKATSASSAGQKERKKPRPTRVMSSANSSDDKKATRPQANPGAAAAAAKPVDEATLQRRLAAKLIKQEGKRKLKEMKARKALTKPRDSRVSFITTSFLEKTQIPNNAKEQHSNPTTRAESMTFTFEDYPALQMHRNTTASTRQNSTPSLSSHRNTHLNPPPSLSPDVPEASSSLPSDTKAATTSKYNTPLRVTQITRSAKSVQGGDLLSDLLPPDHSSDGDNGDSQDLASTYRTALLSAKAKAKQSAKAKQREISPDSRPATITTDTLNTASLKKKVRTSDPIHLDLFALAAHSGKMKKKGAADYAQKYSPGKRRLFEERREEGVHARKGAAVVAKREKINPKKPKKKKVSRVQKCKIEKRQREMLALQLLLKQAKIRQQQQEGLVEVSPPPHTATEESTQEAESGGKHKAVNEPLDTEASTQAKAEGDEGTPHEEAKEKQENLKEKCEEKSEAWDENKENEVCLPPGQPLTINSRLTNTSPEDRNDHKLIWKIKGTDSVARNKTPDPENFSTYETKDKNAEGGDKLSTSPTTGEVDKLSTSPTTEEVDKLSTSPTTEEVDKLSTSPTTGEGDKLSTSPTTGEGDKLSTSPTTGEVDKLSTSPTTEEVDKLSTSPTTGEGDKLSTSPTTEEVDKLSTSPTTGEGDKLSTSPTTGEGDKLSTSPTTGEGDKLSTSPTTGEGDKLSTSPTTGEGDKLSTSPTTEEGDKLFTSPTTGEGDKLSTSPTTGEGDKLSTSPTTGEGDKLSTSPTTEEGDKLFTSPTHLKLLTDDPVIAQKASELQELLRSQQYWRSGPREYCHQVVTAEVNAVAKELITSLIAFQRRHYQRDPTKARIRKRYVCGLKETTKLMGRMSCVIMAPNIQQCEGPGSLDDKVEKLLNQAEKVKVPVVFALSTKGMNLVHKSSRKTSCFGIISYQGAQDLFHRLMQLLPEAQKQYQQLVARGQCTLPKEGEEEPQETGKDVKEQVLAHTSNLLMAP